MSFKEFFAREKHVALNAQSRNFRIAKYIVFLVFFSLLYAWKGVEPVILLFLFCLCMGTAPHFFLRFMTNGWTESWGPYTRIPLNGE